VSCSENSPAGPGGLRVPPGIPLAAKRGSCDGESGRSRASRGPCRAGADDSSSLPLRLAQFFALYRPLTTTWRIFDNSTYELRLIASGAGRETRAVNDATLWERIRAEAQDER